MNNIAIKILQEKMEESLDEIERYKEIAEDTIGNEEWADECIEAEKRTINNLRRSVIILKEFV